MGEIGIAVGKSAAEGKEKCWVALEALYLKAGRTRKDVSLMYALADFFEEKNSDRHSRSWLLSTELSHSYAQVAECTRKVEGGDWRAYLARLGNVYFPYDRPQQEQHPKSWRQHARRRLREDLSETEIAVIETAWLRPCPLPAFETTAPGVVYPIPVPLPRDEDDEAVSTYYDQIRGELRQPEAQPCRFPPSGLRPAVLVMPIKKDGVIFDVELRECRTTGAVDAALRVGFVHRLSISKKTKKAKKTKRISVG
jgi:hypothetical protein